MEKDQLDYIQLIKSSLRDVNRKNLESFPFSKKDIYEKVRLNLVENISYDAFDTFYQYIDLIIEHLDEIRQEDCVNIFINGFTKGIEFERYLKEKYGK